MSRNRCVVCGELTEYEVKVGDEVLRLHRACACEREQKEKKNAEYVAIERAERARDIVNDGYLNTKFIEATFDKDDMTNEKTTARLKNYCAKWEEMKKKNIGLYLFGNTGSGKTFYASAIANYVRKELGEYVLIGSSSAYVQEMFGDFGRNRKLMEYKITHYPLMIIDDLGTESRSEFNMSSLEQIIDLRLGANLPLIVTSNYSPKDLYADGGLLEERIKSRLSEMCVPVIVTKEDRRKGKAVERSK